MTNRSGVLTSAKSPIFIVGLFCLLLLVSCSKGDNPDDVTIEFWTALSENNLEEAKYYSTDASAELFDEKVRNASFQIGKVRYDCDGATVVTRLVRQSAETSSTFNTYLVRDQDEDRWKVDYRHTLKNIDRVADKRFKNLIKTTKESGKSAKVSLWSFIKELGHSIAQLFKNMKERLLR